MKRWEPIAYPGPNNGFGAATHRNFNQSTAARGSWLDAGGYQNTIDEICAAVEGAGYTLDGALGVQLARTIQKGMNYAVATGTANAWVVAPSFAVHAYAAGRVLNIVAPATNTSTTVNMAVSGLDNRRIKKADGADPAVGDLVSGKVYATIDDGTNIRILTPLPSDIVVAQRAAPTYGLEAASAINNIASAGFPATLISAYGSVVNGLVASTFSGGILTVAAADAGLYSISALLTTNMPKAGSSGTAATYAAVLYIDKSTDGGATYVSQAAGQTTSSSVSVLGPFFSAAATVRLAAGDKIRVSAGHNAGVTLEMPVALTAVLIGR
ncbi:hypothetical protein [Bosea sp. (in: a-proteobacteria)]|uniref:hypothetical protein n=1 Tax=Bosea sp. (in: a-proteobacteria) TaxID=1871050 RepID=UPI0027355BDB|nr:hypothetical protein [Bosea sp. (in: a-proteobacteria)]MDP3407226.1 hypothetical protein [Bosea sp. (in: a-proteobacteria)]